MTTAQTEIVPRVAEAVQPNQPVRPRIHVEGAAVELAGSWTLSALSPDAASIDRELTRLSRAELHWDLRGVTALDEFGALLLWRAWQWRLPASILVRPEQEARFSKLPAHASTPRTRPRARPVDLLYGTGQDVILLFEHATGLARLLGELILSVALLPARVRLVPWREISANIYR